MTHKNWLLLAFLAFFACPISAETTNKVSEENLTLKEKVEQAISKYEQSTRKNWAYHISSYENEEGDITSSVEQFIPAPEVEKQWTLIRMNGETPTQKQIKKFLDNKIKQAKAKDKDQEEDSNYSVALREIINLESLTFSSENTSHLKMNFNVYLSELGEDSIGKLQGSLSYNKQHKFIEHINIKNNAEFSPMFSANITELKLAFSFTNINDNVLPLQQEMEMKGTFAYFTEINETSTDSFSNYNYKGSN